MKRTLLLTAVSAALLLTTTANAQIPGVSKVTKALPKVDLGVKIGANFQHTSGDDLSSSYKGGVVGGAFFGIHKNRIGVQIEGLVTSAKITSSASNSDYIKTVNLNIPVMFEYKLFWHVWAQAGPQFATVLSAKDNNNEDWKKYFNNDIGGVIGLEARLPLHLDAGIRYGIGFTNIYKAPAGQPDNTDWKTSTAQIFVGFRFL